MDCKSHNLLVFWAEPVNILASPGQWDECPAQATALVSQFNKNFELIIGYKNIKLVLFQLPWYCKKVCFVVYCFFIFSGFEAVCFPLFLHWDALCTIPPSYTCNGAIHCSGSFVCQIAGDTWPINSNKSLAVHLYRNSNQPCDVYCPSALTRWIVVPCLCSVRNHCLQSWYLPFNCVNN